MGSIDRRNGKWRARWRTPEGASRSRAFRRKLDAERYLATVENSKVVGSYIDPSAGQVTLAEWWQRYQLEAPRRATTAARDRQVMQRWWLPPLGARHLAKITRADVRSVVTRMAAELAPSTVRTDLGVMRAVMNRAVEAELIPRSPIVGIRLPPAQARPPRFLSNDELHRLAEAMPDEYRPIVFVAGVLGLRWSEVAGLRVGSIDFLRRTLTVSETVAEVEGQLMVAPPKSRASVRTLTAPPGLIEMLAAHLAAAGRGQPDEYVFTAPDGGPLRATNFRLRVWGPAISTAGLEGFTFHGLRHSAVGFMIALGVHPRVIQRRAGHSTIRTTFDVYGSVLPELDEAVASGLDGIVSGDGSRVPFVSRTDDSGRVDEAPGL